MKTLIYISIFIFITGVSAQCTDDLTVTDSGGFTCATNPFYAGDPETYCGLFDDADFTASVACCDCWLPTESPTAAPVVPPSVSPVIPPSASPSLSPTTAFFESSDMCNNDTAPANHLTGVANKEACLSTCSAVNPSLAAVTFFPNSNDCDCFVSCACIIDAVNSMVVNTFHNVSDIQGSSACFGHTDSGVFVDVENYGCSDTPLATSTQASLTNCATYCENYGEANDIYMTVAQFDNNEPSSNCACIEECNTCTYNGNKDLKVALWYYDAELNCTGSAGDEITINMTTYIYTDGYCTDYNNSHTAEVTVGSCQYDTLRSNNANYGNIALYQEVTCVDGMTVVIDLYTNSACSGTPTINNTVSVSTCNTQYSGTSDSMWWDGSSCVNTQYSIDLQKQYSHSNCEDDYSFGLLNDNYMWTNYGCDGLFHIQGYDYTHHVHCPSQNFGYSICVIPQCDVYITKHLSFHSPCIFDYSFGCIDKSGIWVNHGCGAEFMLNGAKHVCQSQNYNYTTC